LPNKNNIGGYIMTVKQRKAAKLQLCLALSKMSVKETDKALPFEAVKVGLTLQQAKKAWEKFREEGDPDRAYKHGRYVGKENSSEYFKQHSSIYHVRPKKLSYKQKVKILRSYFFDRDLTSTDVMDLYNIGTEQLYELLKDLRVYGKVGSKTILTWDKHPKVDIIDVRKFNKTKSFTSKNDLVKVIQVKHLNKILEDYLK
jgi:hypothetical protein